MKSELEATFAATDVGPSLDAIENAYRWRRVLHFLKNEGMRIPAGESPLAAVLGFAAKLAFDAARCVISGPSPGDGHSRCGNGEGPRSA